MKLVGHGGAVTTVFVDEGRIYTGSEDEKIRIWDKEVTPIIVSTNSIQSGSLLHTINPEEAKVEEEEEPCTTKHIVYIVIVFFSAKNKDRL